MGHFDQCWQSLSLKTLSVIHLLIVPLVLLSQPPQACSWAYCITLADVLLWDLPSSFFPRPRTVPLSYVHILPASILTYTIILLSCSFPAAGLHNYPGWQWSFARFAVRPLSAWQTQAAFQFPIEWFPLLCTFLFLMKFCWVVQSRSLHFCWEGYCSTLYICWSPSSSCYSNPQVCISVSSPQPNRFPRSHMKILRFW